MIIRPESDPRWQQLLAAKQSNSAKLIKVAGIGSYGQVQAYRLTIRDYLVESHVGSRYEYRSFHMDRSFRVKSITLKRTVPVKPTKVYNIKFQNIPLPPDLWQSGGAAPSAVGIRH
jgi:hypothetical protein